MSTPPVYTSPTPWSSSVVSRVKPGCAPTRSTNTPSALRSGNIWNPTGRTQIRSLRRGPATVPLYIRISWLCSVERMKTMRSLMMSGRSICRAWSGPVYHSSHSQMIAQCLAVDTLLPCIMRTTCLYLEAFSISPRNLTIWCCSIWKEISGPIFLKSWCCSQ